MEADFGKISLRHLQNIVGVGEEHVPTLSVDSHKLVFTLLEGGKRFGIIALYPACLI